MSFFPITLIIILSASMVVALIFLPVLGGIFGKAPPRDEAHEKAIEASETGDWREIPGITGGALDSHEELPGPIYLQGDHGGIAYRNIVLTPAVP